MTGGSEAAWMLGEMMRIRAFEEALSRRPDHGFQLLSTGEEAVAVGLCAALAPEDQLLTGGRSIGPALARGVDPGRLMAELLGRIAGVNRGRAGRGHLADPAAGFFGAHAVVGGNISIAAGVALARQLSGEPGVVAVLFGDGACGSGALHESLNLAALWRLPLLFVCNDNGFSVSTLRAAALAPRALSDLARPFGLPARQADGLDPLAVAAAARDLLAGVRTGEGPSFLEVTSIRLGRHSTTARESRSKAELAELWTRCPIRRLASDLRARGELTPEQQAASEVQARDQAAAALAWAEASPLPGPEEVRDHVG
ncbi:MAG TPA: thiamine pyrophosphate-dependent dehydrogenase E1 component subunit alpha [Caulobacteraceae bacterium]